MPSQMKYWFDLKWCEDEIDVAAPCMDGRMCYAFDHTCGIGKDVKPHHMWRHVLPKTVNSPKVFVRLNAVPKLMLRT